MKSVCRSRHRRGFGDGIAYRGGQAARIVNVEIDQAATGAGHHIIRKRHRAGLSRTVDLHEQLTAMNMEGEAAPITEVTESTGEHAGGNVLDDELCTRGGPGGGQSHGDTITMITVPEG